MTAAKDRTTSTNDDGSQAPPRKSDESQELDAEIVRDLEADERADDVRGGACPTSRPV